MKVKTLLSLTTFLVFLLTSFQTINAQNSRLDLGIGLGLLPTFLKDQAKTTLLPIVVNADYRVGKSFSLGMYAGHSISETDRVIINDGQIAQWRNKFSVMGIRAAAHTTKWEKWDVYGGMTLSYNRSVIEVMKGDEDMISEHRGIRPVSGKLSASGFVGSRYALTEKLGIFGELGFGISILTAGMGYRF